MPLPLILGIGAAIAGLAGIGGGIKGGVKLKTANDKLKIANSRHEKNMTRFDRQNKKTSKDMDKLGTLELKILNSFENFSDVIEKIQNRPEFKAYNRDGVSLPKYNREKLKSVSVGAGLLLGGLGGAAAGAAGGFAAAGATTAAVMALGTASTGTAIASLSGAAAVNATLAALGGGAIAAGGGGMALGSIVLGGATLGVGLLVGGIIFNIAGSGISKKADKAYDQMKKAETKINKICDYLIELSDTAASYQKTLLTVNDRYENYLSRISKLVIDGGTTNWNDFTSEEKLITENMTLLVGLLYNMCKVELVLKSEKEDDLNTINHEEINRSTDTAKSVLEAVDYAQTGEV